MPQIEQLASTYAGQVFWMLIVFALIFFGIGRGMLPRIESTMDGRERKVSDDLAAAARAHAEAEETERTYRTGMDAARAASLAETQSAKAAAQHDAELRVKAADADIAERGAAAEARLAAARDAALANLEAMAADATQDIVSRLSGIAVSPDQAAGAVRRAMATAR